MPYGVGRSALSEQMSVLEEDLHTILFHRRPFQLTPDGQRLHEFCKPFFDGLDNVATELRNGAPDFIGLRELKLEGFPELDIAMMWGLKPTPVTLALMQELRKKAKTLRKSL